MNERPKGLSPQVIAFARDFYRAIGTPLATALEKALTLGDWDTIADCRVDPRAYSSAQEYFLDASAASLLRKNKDLPCSHDRTANAIKKWKQGEADCYRTNERLAPYLEGKTHPLYDEAVALEIQAIRERIQSVLGRAPAIDRLRPGFGPGATFSDPARLSTMVDKITSRSSITHGAYWFLLDWVGTAWGTSAIGRDMNPFPVRGNRFSTAPKDATTHRATAAEPSINVFYQKPVGQGIRSRIKSVGIDLINGKRIHAQAACEASLNGRRATLDLVNASDTEAYNLVRLLLPPDWFSLVDELRSPFSRMGDEDSSLVLGRSPRIPGEHWVRLEKFSSMGNGFTFELETLIFWAITEHSVQRCNLEDPEPTLAFGDDIVCDTRAVRAVTAALRFFGFALNSEKSFSEGRFRESFGGDFWAGRPVRPYFLKGPLDEPQHFIAAANQIRRLANEINACEGGGLGRFSGIWHALQLSVPSFVRRCRGPEWLEDTVFHDDEENWRYTSRRKDKFFGYVPVDHIRVDLGAYPGDAVLACGLYGTKVSEGFINPRDSVVSYGVRRIPAYGLDWVPNPVRSLTRWDVDTTVKGPLRRGPTYTRETRVVRR